MVEVEISDALIDFFNEEYGKYYNVLKETIAVYDRVIDCKSKGLPYIQEDLHFFPSIHYLETETIKSLEYARSSLSLRLECYEKVGSFEIAPEKYISEKRLIVEEFRKRQEELYRKFNGT